MLRLCVIFLGLISLLSASEKPTPSRSDLFYKHAVPFMEKHCYDCHNPEKAKAGIELQDLLNETEALKRHQLLDKLAEAVEYEDMPPDKVDIQPSDEECEEFLKAVARIQDKIANGDFQKNAGRSTIRRLNREEYALTIKDLYGMRFKAHQFFPADASSGSGFNNSGDALFIPPVLMEKYLTASDAIIDKLYENPNLLKKVVTNDALLTLKKNGKKAFRRPLTVEELRPLLSSYDQSIKQGLSHEQALRIPLQALIMHPTFLFRVEADQPDSSEWKISEYELASRLSYFLWSSMPDDELLNLAAKGTLSQPASLKQQTLRMLKDPRSKHFVEHFGGQWLEFDKILTTAYPNTKLFKSYTRTLQKSLYEESILFMHHVLTTDRPVTELIHSDYTFLNEELAKHYGIEGVRGKKMRLVKMDNLHRGGVIGQGAIHVATSMPQRTSPVKRGVWVLNNLFGTPPPPPPPNAGSLPATDQKVKGLTLRRQLEIHRKSDNCAGCHAKIDPLGFGLENFDAIGRWRIKDGYGSKIDSTAILENGKKFSTPYELKQIILEDDSLFLNNLCRQMLAYALGRELEYYDQPLIAEMVQELRDNEMSSHALILHIVQSHPFTHRSSKP